MRNIIIRFIVLIYFVLTPLSEITEGSSSNDQNVSPAPEINIRMAWEKIEITRTTIDRVHTKVTYGFTGMFPNNMELVFPETEWFKLENFKTYFNSIELPMKKISAGSDKFFALGKYHYVALHNTYVPQTVLISKNDENIVINEYDYTTPFFSPGTKTDNILPSGKYIEYILVTGATWKATIGKLEVIFISGASCSQIVELPNSYKGSCKNGNWRFYANDIKPYKNIEIVLTETK